jgi:hypothetical protein
MPSRKYGRAPALPRDPGSTFECDRSRPRHRIHTRCQGTSASAILQQPRHDRPAHAPKASGCARSLRPHPWWSAPASQRLALSLYR